jgi:serum/glucocorticoid-regulated kinase 2
MGNCSQSESNDSSVSITLDHFDRICAIGKGAYGKVWKVRHKSSGRCFAMKEMFKNLIVSKNSVVSIMNERQLLGVLRHPFIVNLYYAFQDHKGLYLVIDLMTGGDLRYFLVKNQIIPENGLKFITACIVAGLEYLHSNGIIHRDLKPENLVFDDYGYLHLTDFGIARTSETDNSGVTSGTPGYMSPEVICCQSHSTVSDYFALGVILFEITTGNRPYMGNSRKNIREAILAKQVIMPRSSLWNEVFEDFVNGLIQRKPEARLGSKGIQEIKEHPWLLGIEWDKLYTKQMKSPFKIPDENNYDKDQVNQNFKKTAPKLSDLSQKQFNGYFFDHSMANRVIS